MLRSVAIIGTGTMGEVILRGILRAKLVPPSRIRATTRSAVTAAKVAATYHVAAGTDNLAAVRGAELVILCLKPMQVVPLLRRLREQGGIARGQLFVSIAAGLTMEEIEEALNEACPVIRAMPNTPCAIGKGTTVLAPGTLARPAHMKAAAQIFACLGATLELEEKHLNTVTGLSGSGPAFAYIMIEALADGGVMMGLPRKVAITLAARTLLGAAEMVLTTGAHPASLKDDVTTPGGCTIGGILALEDGRIRSTLARGVERAARIAGTLGRAPESD
jgi:pyrroline-5-carboxylate reductase